MAKMVKHLGRQVRSQVGRDLQEGGGGLGCRVGMGIGADSGDMTWASSRSSCIKSTLRQEYWLWQSKEGILLTLRTSENPPGCSHPLLRLGHLWPECRSYPRHELTSPPTLPCSSHTHQSDGDSPSANVQPPHTDDRCWGQNGWPSKLHPHPWVHQLRQLV